MAEEKRIKWGFGEDRGSERDEDTAAVEADKAEARQAEPEVKALHNLEKSLKVINVDDHIQKKEF